MPYISFPQESGSVTEIHVQEFVQEVFADSTPIRNEKEIGLYIIQP
jgi:hypothetical protein